MKKTAILATTIGAIGLSHSHAVVIADAAADYVSAAGGSTAILTTLPTGWSYLGSNAANGGAEVAFTAGAIGNQGAAYQGWNGVSSYGTAAVYGTNTASPNEFEIFSNGDPNGGVVGSDLLLHPGQAGNADEYVIVRYTVGDDSAYVAGTGSIGGSFRELVIGGGAANGSVTVDIFQNSTNLFSTTGNQSTPNALTMAEGAFNLTGLTLTTGDTIDFVVGINGHFGADEVALNAQISVDQIPEPASALLLGLGTLGWCLRRRSR